MIQLFDSHAHLQDRALLADADGAVARARAAGVAGILCCGYDAESNTQALELAARHDIVFAAVGFHPHDAKELSAADLAELETLAALPEVVAVGEIGLDFYRDLSPHNVQRRALDDQLAIAIRVAKPVSVHTRGAEAAIAEHLLRYAASSPLLGEGRPVGVLHCFGGTLEQALPLVDAGFLVSIACAITYPKNLEARRLARELPLTALLVETDAPYLPPQPLRGKRNEPAFVRTAVEAIAAERGLTTGEVGAATTANALRTFLPNRMSKLDSSAPRELQATSVS